MIKFLSEAGPFIFLQAALALVILSLTLINAVRLALRSGERAAAVGRSIDAILFWGSLTAIFGFLGQWVGLYRGANAIFDHGAVNPALVVLGLGESLNTSVVGMFTLVIAAFLWFCLRSWMRARVAVGGNLSSSI
ncbi:MAG: hypothetical protein GY769_15175 [bacterium]|nr:hypothetical protein [bacterium]